MTPATRRDGDPAPPARALRLVLELTMANGELASGTVMAEGGSAPTSFHGWIGLMDAISQLNDQADRARLSDRCCSPMFGGIGLRFHRSTQPEHGPTRTPRPGESAP